MTWTHWQVPPFITGVFFVLGVLTLYWVSYNWLVSWSHHQRRFKLTDDQLNTWYGTIYMAVFIFCIQSLVVGSQNSWQFMNFQLIAIIFCAYFLNSHAPYYAFIPILLSFMIFNHSLGYWQSWVYALVLMAFVWALTDRRAKIKRQPWDLINYLLVGMLFGAALWFLMLLKFKFSWQVLVEEWGYLVIFELLLYCYITIVSHDSALKLRLAQFASHDALTQAENFAAYTAAIQSSFMIAQKTQMPMTMIMFDIDHFKQVNDIYGHVIGDRVLQQVTAVVRIVLTENDPQLILYRTGGEEFNILLPNYSLADSQTIVNQIFIAINHLTIQTGQGKLQLSISVGVSALAATDHSPIDFYKRVDRKLYQSKRRGRMTVTSD